MNPKLSAAYSAKRMAKGGAVSCSHGGPIHCDMGCYAQGGEVMKSSMYSSKDLIANLMAKKMDSMMDDEDEAEEHRYEQDAKDFSVDDMEDPLYAQGGLVDGEDDLKEAPQTMMEHLMDRMKKKKMMKRA